MTIKITPLAEADIQSSITAIQDAFAEDPYNLWIFNDRKNVSSIVILALLVSHENGD